MSMELFTHIVDELPKEVKKVYLMKQGEPFVNKNFASFVEHLRRERPEINISFHTNGILATKERLEKVLPLVDSIGVSISATTREVYKETHGTDKFEAVMENLAALSSLRLGLAKEKRPHAFIDYIRQSTNRLEGENEVVEFFRKRFPGLSSVDFHAVNNFQEEINEGALDIYKKLPYECFPMCVFPWSSITFCHDGKVSYCFVEPRENSFIGDITEQTFEEIWNGKAYNKFRERMEKKAFGELSQEGFYCYKCSWLWTIRSQSPRNLNGGFTIKREQRLWRFEDLLDLTEQQLFALGVDHYLDDDIHLAMGCFGMLKARDVEDEKLLDGVDIMLGKCRRVLGRYADLPLWQKTLEEEEHPEEQQMNRYYPID
jgi:radical SAM protein with 4Fe4S-binding SPASM domain